MQPWLHPQRPSRFQSKETDAHRHNGKRLVVIAGEKLAAFPERYDRLLLRRDELAVAPGIADSGINCQRHCDPNQDRSSLVPGAKPPCRSFIRVTELVEREHSEKENYRHD